MEIPTLMVFTHDAMGDGEDGPTHQPIEQLASLRAMPGMTLLRPGDANEVVEAYRVRAAAAASARDHGAVAAAAADARPHAARARVRRGEGRLRARRPAAAATPEVILIATGSEVSLAVAAHDLLVADGIRSRVVSMPSWDIFEMQPQEYRDSVLPPAITARVAIEQASTFGWERYVGGRGA